jgi:hypothetical protein
MRNTGGIFLSACKRFPQAFWKLDGADSEVTATVGWRYVLGKFAT